MPEEAAGMAEQGGLQLSGPAVEFLFGPSQDGSWERN